MRVLQVHTRYREAGGEDTVLAAEAELLRGAGHEVIQWVGQNPLSGGAALLALARAPTNRAAAAEVARFAAEADPDVIHVHNTWFATSPAVLASLGSAVEAPIVMTLHNYRLVCANALLLRDGAPCEVCVGRGPWSAVRYGCYRDSRIQSIPAAATIAINRRRRTWVDNVHRFLALTNFARGRLIAGGLPAQLVDVKPNFVPDPGDRPAAAEQSSQVLFVGRITAEKGIRTLLEAWRRSTPGELQLVIAGDGPLLGELRAQHWPDTRFLGRVDRATVQQLMFASRALVFPSQWYEGMPMTILEAMASSLPVLGSDLGSLPEMLVPMGEKWLVEAGAAEAWSAAFAVLDDDQEVAAASSAARETWRRAYSPERGLRNLLDAYRP